MRASHDLIEQSGEFVVNIPWPELEQVSNFVGTTTMRKTDKWLETGLTQLPAMHTHASLIAECPVNIECKVIQQLKLPSHSMFIGQVVALHADGAVLNERNEVDFNLARGGLPYRSGPVRERPVAKFRPDELLADVRQWRQRKG
jgi:flavin reductase (DIM6/NTAB) family NADH-FMN oxidoreductase RutF